MARQRRRIADLDVARLSESIPYLVHKVYARLQRLRPHSDGRPDEDRAVIFEMMLLLGANPGISQADVSHALSMDKSNVATLMRALERAGLLSRRRQAEDARCFGVFLTPAGVKHLAQMQLEWQRREQALVAALNPAERRSLVALLSQIVEMPL